MVNNYFVWTTVVVSYRGSGFLARQRYHNMSGSNFEFKSTFSVELSKHVLIVVWILLTSYGKKLNTLFNSSTMPLSK